MYCIFRRDKSLIFSMEKFQKIYEKQELTYSKKLTKIEYIWERRKNTYLIS